MNKDLELELNTQGFELSSTNKRALAYLIDDVLISILVLAIFWEYIQDVSDFEQIILTINRVFFEIVTIKILYHTFFIWKYGATLGKMFAKIKVIQVSDFNSPSFGIAFNRAIFRVISEMLFYIGFFIAFFDKFRQSLHDKSAKTLVVNA
ncbi:MAG: RDD family protein [Campylobacterales bacterium]|nr:RDD family protein [Campylobacterales bacterium]